MCIRDRGCSLKGNISLNGFMGTGKTTVSKALSKITSFKEIDVDAYIVENEGKAIRDIFCLLYTSKNGLKFLFW